MAFHDVLLPIDISYGLVSRPKWKTRVVETDSGFVQAVASWTRARLYFECTYDNLTQTQIDALRVFHFGRRGRLHFFRLLDWADYRTTLDGSLTTMTQGDGTTTEFQLHKVYADSVNPYSRRITKPINPSAWSDLEVDVVHQPIEIAVNGTPLVEGVGYTVDYDTGVVTFSSPPGSGHNIDVYFEFHVPVRFETDDFETSIEYHNNFATATFTLAEELEEEFV